MENPEEILHSLEEFSKLKPKDIPRELEDYLCFVAKTGDPVYQWGTVKSLFKEKLINVITDFYESCPSVDIPPCPNVEVFNYESMKTFILEKLDTFVAAPFTVQRICELLTTPRKEYNRIDKYMRALEKNILVVSTTEPGNRRTAENGDGIVNGIESEHLPETNNTNDINVEEMDDSPVWSRITSETVSYQNTETNMNVEIHPTQTNDTVQSTFIAEPRTEPNCGSTIDSVITCRPSEEQPYVSIEPVASEGCLREESMQESDVTVTITAIPAAVQKRRDSIEPVVSTVTEATEQTAEFVQNSEVKEALEMSPSSSPSVTIEILPNTLSNEAEPSEPEKNETTVTAIPVLDKPQPPEDENEDSLGNDQSQQEPPLIQIPIISEITTEVEKENTQESSDVVIPPLDLHAQETLSSEDSTSVLIKEVETDSEATDEISTTVTSSVECAEPQQSVICENSALLKESSVSSSDEVSNDALDVNLKVDNLSESDSDEVKDYKEEVSQGSSLTDCIIDTDSNLDEAVAEGKPACETVVSSIHEFASSSTTNHESMEVDIEEESLLEPPTSHG